MGVNPKQKGKKMYLNETEFLIIVVLCILFGYFLNKFITILEKTLDRIFEKFNLN